MKTEYSKMAYRRWRSKGWVSEEEGKRFLSKDGKRYEISFKGNKVLLRDVDQLSIGSETQVVEDPQ